MNAIVVNYYRRFHSSANRTICQNKNTLVSLPEDEEKFFSNITLFWEHGYLKCEVNVILLMAYNKLYSNVSSCVAFKWQLLVLDLPNVNEINDSLRIKFSLKFSDADQYEMPKRNGQKWNKTDFFVIHHQIFFVNKIVCIHFVLLSFGFPWCF